MKKIIILILSVFTIIFLLDNNVYASNYSILDSDCQLLSSEKVVADDDSYYVISIYKKAKLRDDNIITEIKTEEYYDANDNLIWEFRLVAQFEVYPGISSTCTYSAYAQFIYSSGWSFENGNAYYSGQTAYASGTFKEKVIFITIRTMNVSLSLYCDIHGNVS